MESEIKLGGRENLYNIESWLDKNGKPCYPGAIIEYESDVVNALSGRNIKLYSKVTQSEYGWWGGSSAREWIYNKSSRPDPMWTFVLNTDGFRILDGEEADSVWKSEIEKAEKDTFNQ